MITYVEVLQLNPPDSQHFNLVPKCWCFASEAFQKISLGLILMQNIVIGFMAFLLLARQLAIIHNILIMLILHKYIININGNFLKAFPIFKLVNGVNSLSI